MSGRTPVTPLAGGGAPSPVAGGARPLYGARPRARAEPAPWPAALPPPAPADVPRRPRPAAVTDAAGAPVGVSGRLRVSAAPAELTVVETGERLPIRAWAGPWPLAERWWEPGAAVRR